MGSPHNDALDTLGENRQPFVDCFLQAIEMTYENFDAMLADGEGRQELSMQCLMPILLPADVYAGIYDFKWSEEDIASYWEYAQLVKDAMEDYTSEFDPIFDCQLEKLMVAFESFDAALEHEEETIALIEACVFEVLGDE